MANWFYQNYGKRWMDLLIAVPALLLLGPLLACLVSVIRVRLGSPVFFCQRRPGRQGRSFQMIKFRSMTDSRDASGDLLPDADRLTPFGQFLRESSLDELPELWNVIRGDMSLVGPRPLFERYLSRYSVEQARRHHVRPGITGWAQVNGRNDISWERKFELDVWYVDQCSFWLDLKILLLTVMRVVRKDGISRAGHATTPEFFGAEAGPSVRGAVGRTGFAISSSATSSNTESSRKKIAHWTNDGGDDAQDEGIIVLGAGGHAKVVISTLQAAGRRVVAAYEDDPSLHGKYLLGVPICGATAELEGRRDLRAVIAVGDCPARRALAARFDFQWISVVHPTAWVHESVTLGPGTVICAGAMVQPESRIGAHAIINTSASVDHDSVVGSFAHVCPGAHLAGNVTVGELVFLGTGSSVVPGVTIGRSTIVGAGAVVVGDLPAEVVAVGCPARITRSQKDNRYAA